MFSRAFAEISHALSLKSDWRDFAHRSGPKSYKTCKTRGRRSSGGGTNLRTRRRTQEEKLRIINSHVTPFDLKNASKFALSSESYSKNALRSARANGRLR